MEVIVPSTREYIQSRHIASDYDNYYSDFSFFRLDTQILDDLVRKDTRILDIGCATGRHLVHFSKKGLDIVGVDLSFHMLGLAKRKMESEGLSPKLIQADMHNLSCIKRKFDAVILMYSTFGLVKGRDNRIRVLKGIFKLLNDDGILIMHIYKDVLGEILKFIDLRWYLRNFDGIRFNYEPGDYLIKNFRGVKNFYFHRFIPSELRELFGLAQLKLVDSIYIHRSEERLTKNQLERFLSDSMIVVAKRLSFKEELLNAGYLPL